MRLEMLNNIFYECLMLMSNYVNKLSKLNNFYSFTQYN